MTADKRTSRRGAGKQPAAGERRRRLSPAERERQIVDGAIGFFAEHGFAGQTRALAERLGIAQPLLYRYFPDKDALIERVYKEVYLGRWRKEWETLLVDRSRPLRGRMVEFYRQYAEAIFTYEWVRIFIFAGLKGGSIQTRYLDLIKDKVFRPVCAELREQAGLPSCDDVPLDELELECAWALHGGFFYLAIRKFVYGVAVPDDLEPIIEAQVDGFLEGATAAMRRLYREPGRKPTAPEARKSGAKG